MPRRTRDRLAAALFHLAGILVTVTCLLPLFWVVVASLRAPGLPPASAIEWWPSAAHWDNYAELFRIVPMGRYVLNSLIVVIIAVPVTILVAALAGFALSQLGTVWRRRLVFASVALLLIPGMAIWTLRFYVLNWLGLIDSLAALIVPAVAGGSPLFILLFYWACWRIPPELYESARLEGAGAWTVWSRRRPAPDLADHRGGDSAGFCSLLGRFYDAGPLHLSARPVHAADRSAAGAADGRHEYSPADGWFGAYDDPGNRAVSWPPAYVSEQSIFQRGDGCQLELGAWTRVCRCARSGSFY